MRFDAPGSVLRWTATLVLVLCAVAVVVGFIPGVDVYEDKNDCIGHAFARAFSWHGGGDRTPCVRHDVLLRTEAAGGWALVLALLPIALGGFALRRWPRLWIAALWPLVMIGSAAVFFAMTFELDLFSPVREVPRWPATLLGVVLGAIVVILLVVLVFVPVVGIARWWRERSQREPAPDPIARARVVKMPD